MKFNRQALRVSLVYCLGAGLWIIVTNWLVHRYTSNADLLERLQDFKGCFFVLLTALLLYLALSRIFRRMEREEARRRLSSEALWASEVHYRSLFDNMQEGFAFCRMIYDNGRPVDFIYLEVNRNFEKLTGLRDVAGRKVSEAIPGLREANPELFEIYGRVVATGQPEHFELFIQPLNAWLSISAYALEKGCFVAVFENITGRKQSEAERQQKAALFEALVNSLPEGILVVSGERKKILQNEQFNKLLKIPPHIAQAASMADDSEQLKFVTDSTRHPEQFRDKVLYLEAHPEETSRDEIEFKDGRILDRNTAPAFGKNKEYYGRIWTFRDISERKQAEAQYQVQSAALSAAANAIVIADRQGTIRWVNAAFTRLTGYTFAEAVGQNPRVLKSGQHDDAFYQSMWETVLRGDVWRGELVNKRKDGSLYTEDMTITPVRSAGNGITHFIAIKQDVTENRLLEEKLRQSQKMEAFGQLAGGVAHDFNNAMSVIQLQADMLKGEGGLSPNQNLLVDEIGKAVQHSSHLARQLLLFSRKKSRRCGGLTSTKPSPASSKCSSASSARTSARNSAASPRCCR
jgi:PAS domain S-box-containing protein